MLHKFRSQCLHIMNNGVKKFDEIYILEVLKHLPLHNKSLTILMNNVMHNDNPPIDYLKCKK